MGQADVGLVVELQGVGSGGGQVREDRVGIAADMSARRGSRGSGTAPRGAARQGRAKWR